MQLSQPTVYIASRISDSDPDKQEGNVELGIAYAELLESKGFKVYCPHRELRPFARRGASYIWLMKRCFKAIRERADVVLFLDGWRDSRGARYEHAFVDTLNHLRPKTIRPFYDVKELLRAYP